MLERNQRKGITLISLVITIILLLILATVAINLAVDSDGLFSKAGDAANKWNSSVAEEDGALQNLMTMLDEMDKPTLGKVYNEDMIGQSVTYSANGQDEWIILGEDPEKAGHILITTKAPVADGFEPYGSAEKWLSYEEDLHEACSVYGGSIGGVEVEARSITMEDINLVTGFEEIKSEIAFNASYIFGKTQDYANGKVNYIYPKVGSTWTDGAGTAWSSWKLPTAENEETFDDCDDPYYYNDTQYVYVKDGAVQTVSTTTHIDPVKGDIIWGAENDLMYLVGERSVCVDASCAYFSVALVHGGCADSYYGGALCFAGADVVYEYGAMVLVSVRPVVSVPANVPVEEVNGVYDFVQID